MFEHLDVSLPGYVVDAVAHLVSQQASQALDPLRRGRLSDEVEKFHGTERLIGLVGVGNRVKLRGRDRSGASTAPRVLVVRRCAVELPPRSQLPLQRSRRIQVVGQSLVAALRALPLHLNETAAALGLACVRAAAGVEDLDLRARVAAVAQLESLAGVVQLTYRPGGDAICDVGIAAEDGPAYRDAIT